MLASVIEAFFIGRIMLWTFFLWAHANPGELFLKMNVPQLAREHAQKSLQKNPDNVNAHAQMAIALCRLGRYHEAIVYFEFAKGASMYPVRLHEYHADALRYMRRGKEAADVRAELLMDPRIPTGMHPRIMSGMIDDLRYVQHDQEALEIAFRLMSKHPNAALSYAMMAEIYLDRGALDEAFFYIWRGRKKTFIARTEEVYARYLLLRGFPERAEQHIKVFFEANVRNELLALYAQSKLLAYGPQKALALLDRNKFRSNQSPMVLFVRKQAYQALLQESKEQEIDMLLRQLYGY